MGKRIVCIGNELLASFFTHGRTFPDRDGYRIRVTKGIPEDAVLEAVSNELFLVSNEVAMRFSSPSWDGPEPGHDIPQFMVQVNCETVVDSVASPQLIHFTLEHPTTGRRTHHTAATVPEARACAKAAGATLKLFGTGEKSLRWAEECVAGGGTPVVADATKPDAFRASVPLSKCPECASDLFVWHGEPGVRSRCPCGYVLRDDEDDDGEDTPILVGELPPKD